MKTVIELLEGVEMPEPIDFGYRNSVDQWVIQNAYTADQLRSTVAAAVLRKDTEIAELKTEIDRLDTLAITWKVMYERVSEACQDLDEERKTLKAKMMRYQAHGVTCQIYGHVVGACSECNTHDESVDTLKAENERLRDLMGEAASNCKASIAEDGISDSRRVYRSELLHRLNAAMKGQP